MSINFFRIFMIVICIGCTSLTAGCQNQPEIDLETAGYADELILPDGYEKLTNEEGAERLFRTTLEMKEGQKSGLVPFKTFQTGDKLSPGIIYIPAQAHQRAREQLVASTLGPMEQGLYLIQQNNEWKACKINIEYFYENPNTPNDDSKVIINVDGTIASMPFNYTAIACYIPIKK